MKKIIYFVVPIVLLIISSCNYSNNTDKKVSFFKQLIPDTLFYPDGSLKSVFPRLENGQRHGLRTDYYQNGRIRVRQIYCYDQQVGSEYWYYENGSLEYYAVRDTKEKIFFALSLDSLGNIAQRSGLTINPVIEIEDESDNYKIGNEHLMRLLYADPKVFKFQLDSVILSTKTFNKNFKDYYFEKEKGFIYIDFKPKYQGENKFIFYSSLRKKNGESIKSDRLEFRLNVIK
jgi:hypothetical protein